MRFESTGRKRGPESGRPNEESGGPAWDRGPRKARSVAGVVSYQRVGPSILASLSEAGGNDLQKVTSKPLSPSLVSLYISSCGTRPRHLLLHGQRQCVSRAGRH